MLTLTPGRLARTEIQGTAALQSLEVTDSGAAFGRWVPGASQSCPVSERADVGNVMMTRVGSMGRWS